MHLKLASRSSDLARWQAFKVGREIEKHHPEIKIEYVFKSSFGDQNLDLPLSQMESRGVFTQDFYVDLKNGTYDLVVHSWKDLPVEAREGVEVIATLKRADARDVLLIPKAVYEKALKNSPLKILTSSPRRIYNLSPWLSKLLPNFISEIEFAPVRGNIPSRLEKMFTEQSGLILAKAALDRMLSGDEGFEEVKKRVQEKLKDSLFMVLPLEINPCAPAQGALAIEIASHREDLKNILQSINDEETFRNVEMEREILKSYGGGCHQKIGVARLTKNYGVYHVEKGESDWGTKLSRCELLQNHRPVSFKGTTSQQIFPLSPKDNSWFDRVPLKVNKDALIDRSVLVARFTDRVDELESAKQIWASGLKTWVKLAQEGFWVNGCFEGLGETEKNWVGPLGRNLPWVKLSHSRTDRNEEYQVIPYYQLENKPKEMSPDLTDKKAFYWMSSSSFNRAFELYPDQIRDGFHACGPGLTYEALKNHQALKNPPEVFLNLEEFHDFLKRSGMKF